MHEQLNIGHLGASGRVIPLKGYVFNIALVFVRKEKGGLSLTGFNVLCCICLLCRVGRGAFTVIRAASIQPHLCARQWRILDAIQAQKSTHESADLRPIERQNWSLSTFKQWRENGRIDQRKAHKKPTFTLCYNLAFTSVFSAVLSSVIGLISG